MTITTSFVSSTIGLGVADAGEALEKLAGRELASGQVKLSIGTTETAGLAGAVILPGVLRTPGPLGLRVPVEIMVSPWSAQKSEVGIRPLGRIGHLDSLRSRVFFKAAWQVMDVLAAALAAGAPAATDAVLEPLAA